MASLMGSIAPLVTPFCEDGARVDEGAIERLVEWHLAEGSHGIGVTGTTGEPSALSMAERRCIIERAARTLAGRAPLLAGTGTDNLDATLELTAFAETVGADAVLVIVPYYIRPSQEGLFRYFAKVASGTGLPVILYNIPGRAAQNLEPETMARLRERAPNIAGVKEANPDLDQVTRDLALCGRDFLVFSGIETLCFPMLALGGSGHVSATANILPGALARLYNLTHDGRWEEARELHHWLFALNRALFIETNPVPVKTALGAMGRIDPAVRLPLAPMTGAHETELREVLGRYGLIGNDLGTTVTPADRPVPPP